MIKAESNVADVIVQLGNYRTRLSGASVEFRNRLCDLGAEEAREAFAGAEYAGTNDVSVTTEQHGKESLVVAKGNAVYFLEFGAGVTAGEGYPGPKPPDVVGLGEYGYGQGANDLWIYKGEPGTSGTPVSGRPGRYWSYGNPPVAGMYTAARTMEDNAVEVAKEVLA